MTHSDSAVVVIQESRGNWAGLLRRQLGSHRIAVQRVETLEELQQPLNSARFGVFAFQVEGFARGAVTSEESLSKILTWLVESRARFPNARFCGLSNETTIAWPIYEAGASLVIDHPLQVVHLARFVRRYVANLVSTEIVRESPLAGTENVCESLWLRLPWEVHAVAKKLKHTKPIGELPEHG